MIRTRDHDFDTKRFVTFATLTGLRYGWLERRREPLHKRVATIRSYKQRAYRTTRMARNGSSCG